MQSNFTCYTAKMVFLLSILSRFPVKISEYSCLTFSGEKNIVFKKENIGQRGQKNKLDFRNLIFLFQGCSFLGLLARVATCAWTFSLPFKSQTH